MKYMISFLYSFGSKSFSLLILLACRVLTARMLGPSELGSLANALNFTSVISRWGSCGIAPATQFMAAKYPEKRNTLLVYTLSSSVFLGILNLLLVYFFYEKLTLWQFQSDDTAQSVFRNFFPFLPLIILSMSLPVFILGSGKMKAYSLTQVIPLLLQSLLVLFAFLQPAHLDYLILAQICYWASTLILALLCVDFKKSGFYFDYNLLKVFFKYALKSCPQVILQFGTARFAIVIGSRFLNTENLGYYVLASGISEAFMMIYTSVNPLIFNKVSREGSDCKHLSRTIRLSNILFLFITLLLLLSGKPLMLFLFGPYFAASWEPLLLLLLSVFFQGTMRLCINYFTALNKNRIAAVIQMLQLLILVVLCPLLCLNFDVAGLCFASIAASAGGVLCAIVFLRQTEEESFDSKALFIPDQADFINLKRILEKLKRNLQIGSRKK